MNEQKIAELLTKLLRLQSYDPRTSGVPNFVFEYLKGSNIHAQIVESNGIKNIVARTSGEPRILFNGHWDTVLPKEEWRNQELYFEQNEKYISGLGACDMKAGVASMIAAFFQCHEQNIPGVILCLVGDEELGGENGTKVLVDKKIIAPNIILGEPTNLAVSQGQKSGFTVRVNFKGKSAHGAYPHRGENAILKAMKYAEIVDQLYPIADKNINTESAYHRTTASLNLIQGGSVANVVAAECTLTYDVRFPPTQNSEDVKENFEKTAKDFVSEVTIFGEGNGWLVDKNTKLFSIACEAVKTVTNNEPDLIYKMGTNDGKYYAPHGCNIINIGPGDNKLSHSMEEKVSIKELIEVAEIYVHICKQI